MLRKLSFFFNFRHKKWLDLNQDIICIIKHNKKRLGKWGLAEVGSSRRRSRLSLVETVATALLLDAGDNDTAFLLGKR